MQKARSQAVRRQPSYRLSAHGFRIFFTRHLAYFSPFPHGTRALSVIEEYLGLEGGPPRFAQNSTCSALLGIPLGAVRVQLPGCHRLWRALPGRFTLASCIPRCGPTTPRGHAPTVWPLPRSLTATRRISVDFYSSRYGDVSVPRVGFPCGMTDLAMGRVSPFGHPGITAHVQLPQAYRSLSRPSSPLDAKASTVCLIAFDLKFSCRRAPAIGAGNRC